jgi:phage-related protein
VRERPAPGEKPVIWVGSAKRDLLAFPVAVMKEIGSAISAAQFGGRHPAVKAWKGEGPGVLEIVEDFQRGAYRAVYTVRFERVLYILHCFQKKSPSGIHTARNDIELIRMRLKAARADYEKRYGQGTT